MSFFKNLFGRSSEHDSFDLPQGTDANIGLIASSDSTRLAYAVRDWRGSYLEVNGRRLKNYAAVSGITFSPDSRHIAYAAMRRDKWFVVLDDIEYEPYDDIGKTSPVFSPDSKRIAYGARRGREWFAVVDGNITGGPFEGFSPGGIVFSPDSQRILYVVKKGDSWTAVVDGKEQKPFYTIIEKSWCFSPDSKKVAYAAGVKGKRIGYSFVGESGWVMDDEIHELWKHDETTKKDGISNEIYFSPDSKRVAYGVTQNGKFLFVIDGVRQKSYNGLVSGWQGNQLWSKFPDYNKAFLKSECIVFSPDSRHFAYGAASENQHVLIYDGEEKGKHQAILNSPPVFSPDSKRLAYGAEKGTKQFLVVDWNSMTHYDGLPPASFAFNSNSKNIAYIASNGTNYYLVVDLRSWLLNDGPVIGAKLVWDDSQHLHTLVAKGRNISIVNFDIG